jgi:hypothetical protein
MIAIAWALIGTEAIKLRRSVPLLLALVAPALAIALELAAVFGRIAPPFGNAAAKWHALLLGGWAAWTGLCLPVLIAFEAACLANLEHAGKHWKQLFAYPIPRWSVYAVKMLFCGLLAWIGMLIAVPGLIGGVLIYSGVHGLGLASSIPWLEIFSTAGRACLASCLLIAIQTWISVRLPGIAMPVGIGLAGLVVGLMLFPLNDTLASWSPASWWPWMLSLRSLPTNNPRDLHNPLLPVVFGFAGGILAGACACWDLTRRRQSI